MAGMRGRTKRFTLTLVYLQLQSFQCSNAVSPAQCAPGTWSGSGLRCPWGWGERSYAGCLYYNSNDKLSWWDARDGCVAFGGYLATADSYSEYAVINQYRLDTDGLSGDGWDTWGGIYRSGNASMGTAGTKALCGRARRGLEAAPGRGGRQRGR